MQPETAITFEADQETHSERSITPNSCDDVFKMLETEGLIGSAAESHTTWIATTDLPSHPTHNIFGKKLGVIAAEGESDECLAFGTGSDDIFDQFYLENTYSPLSAEKFSAYRNESCNSDSDDLNSVEMVEEMISTSRSPIVYNNYSPYAPYASWSTAVPYSVTPPCGTPPVQKREREREDEVAAVAVEPCFNRWSVDQILAENLSIQELIAHDLIPRVITHQHGSRFLQNVLKRYNNNNSPKSVESENDDLISLLLNHLIAKHDLTRLCEDRYGNYSIQILFERGNAQQHEKLLNAFMYSNILRLSRSEYGCRVVQKALRCIFNEEFIAKLVSNLESQALSNDGSHTKLDQCLLDSNANHVIQAIINLELPFENVKFIKVCLEEKLSFYSEHAFACRVVQCFIKQYGDKLAVNKLFENGAHLRACQSMYGNYVIQCIIEPNAWYSRLKGISKFRWKLITELFCGENLLFLSKNKFGSNVMESCIRVSTEKQITGLIMILSSGNLFLIQEMIKHRFGNYVIKTLLNYANKKQQMRLIQIIDLSFKCNGNELQKPNVYTEILMHEIRRITMTHHMHIDNMDNNNMENNYYDRSHSSSSSSASSSSSSASKSKKRARYFLASKKRYYNRC